MRVFPLLTHGGHISRNAYEASTAIFLIVHTELKPKHL